MVGADTPKTRTTSVLGIPRSTAASTFVLRSFEYGFMPRSLARRSTYTQTAVGDTLLASYAIHLSAWKGYSANFGLGQRKRSGLLLISQVSSRVQAPKRTFEEVKHMNGGKGIYVGGTLLSILISLALYFSGKRETAIFVGLWAPTILNLGQTLIDEG
jgi:hypothetical protein